jgi:hypothetical protein
MKAFGGFGSEKNLDCGAEMEKPVVDKHGLMKVACMRPLLKIVTV